MSVFENFGKKVSEAAQSAAKKSGDIIEVTKLNMNISNEEEKINKLLLKIGKSIYDQYINKEDLAAEYQEICLQINEIETNIDALKIKIRNIRNQKICAGCNAEIEKGINFCPHCGAKQEKEVVEETIEEIPVVVDCSKCGAKIENDASFCTACGEKLG